MKIERQLQGSLNTVFTELIKEKGLQGRIQPYPVQEEGRADIMLKSNSGKNLFFIELKDPTSVDGKSVFDGNILMRETSRAQKLEIKYFGNCNFLACAFFDTTKLYEKQSISDGFFTLLDIVRLSKNYAPGKDIENKLRSIANFYLDRAIEIIERKPIAFNNPDELFIFKIRKLIEGYAYPVSDKVWEKYRSDKQFEKEIGKYTQSQLWNKPQTYEEIENLSHIALLMLISKLIFYKAYVDNQTYHALHPMKVSDDIKRPKDLEKLIWQYFVEFKEITGNFELLIGERADIIFQIPFVSEAVIELVKDVLNAGEHYNFSNIPFDIIGRIFEELIREDERHKLGQYFTPPDVIDLINSFAIRKANYKVFDPSCGSGTFLVRAYERKKNLYKDEGKGAPHDILLNEIYGNDLSGYPAYLSMLNLAIRNTRKPSYPRIVNKDFFAITANTNVTTHDQNGNEEKKQLPKFDAIVGNPPYTRQKDIGVMHGTVNQSKIHGLIKSECNFEPSQRTSIYAYFFYHANVFLKDKGYLAFICQNSWLDTDYGIDMQRFLMLNFEIVTIIDSEVERFFPTASVNTTIVIARKQRDESARNKNLVKFVYLTNPLIKIIKDYKGVEVLQEFIESTETSVTNRNFRINCINQELLHQHDKWGNLLKAPKIYFDILKKGQTIFKNLSGKNGIANIYYGLKSGCNEYFFGDDVTDFKEGSFLAACINNSQGFTKIAEVKKAGLRIFKNGLNECWLIEKIFLQKSIKLTRNISQYIIDKVDSTDVIFHVNRLSEFIKEGQPVYDLNAYRRDMKNNFPFAFAYIRHGENAEIKGSIVSEKPSVSGRPAWWDLGEQKKKDFILIQFRDKRNWNPSVATDFLMGNVAFFGEYKNNKKKKLYFISLNSAFAILQSEMLGRVNLGDGLLTTYGPDLAVMQVLDSSPSDILQKEIDEVYNLLHGVDVVSIFEELGTQNESQFNLSKVLNHRFRIDDLFLKLLGYSNKKERENILCELYRATIQTVNGRIQKAQSMKGVKTQRNRVEFSVYVQQLKAMLIEEKVVAKNTLTFGRQCEKFVKQITAESKMQKKILDSYWKEKFGELYNEKNIGYNSQVKLF